MELFTWKFGILKIRIKEQNEQIQKQKKDISEYRDLRNSQKEEIEKLEIHACDKCDFKTKSISVWYCI